MLGAMQCAQLILADAAMEVKHSARTIKIAACTRVHLYCITRPEAVNTVPAGSSLCRENKSIFEMENKETGLSTAQPHGS